MAEIRDFIYLDVERVRSFVAQGGGGVPTERSNAAEHQAGGGTSASGGIPLIASVKGQAEYHYLRTHTETRSVQDAIFDEFIATLRPLDISAVGPWPDSTVAPDGRLVLVQGFVKLIDYEVSLDTLRAFPKVTAAYEKFNRSMSGARPNSGAPSARRGSDQSKSAASPFSTTQMETLGPLVEQLSKLVGTNLTDFVRIKVVPNLERPDEAVVGDGHRENFRYPSAILSSLYPRGIAAGWSCVGVVHRADTSELPASPGRATMGDMLESLLDSLGGLEAFRQTAPAPAVAMTPLAIYRTLIHG